MSTVTHQMRDTADAVYDALLGELRAEFGRQRLRQSRVAPMIGMRQQHLSNRLNGVTPFTVVELVRLTRALGIDPEDLLKTAEAASGQWAPRDSNPQSTVNRRAGTIPKPRLHLAWSAYQERRRIAS